MGSGHPVTLACSTWGNHRSASGVPVIPPEAMERMKPEQRVMLQGMLIALIAQAYTPHTARMCITPDQLRAGFDPNRVSSPAAVTTWAPV
jgi:hypothetical protein